MNKQIIKNLKEVLQAGYGMLRVYFSEKKSKEIMKSLEEIYGFLIEIK